AFLHLNGARKLILGHDVFADLEFEGLGSHFDRDVGGDGKPGDGEECDGDEPTATHGSASVGPARGLPPAGFRVRLPHITLAPWPARRRKCGWSCGRTAA